MSKRLTAACIGIMLTLTLWPQGLMLEGGYAFVSMPEWNRATRVYNFSRPFLTQPQPLLRHGYGAEFTYTFRADRRLLHQVGMRIVSTESRARGGQHDAWLRCHLLAPGYGLQWNPRAGREGLRLSVFVAPVLTLLRRKLNGSWSSEEGAPSGATGIGGEVRVKICWLTALSGGRAGISCSAGLGPALYAPRAEAVINQTQRLVTGPQTVFFSATAGLCYLIGPAPQTAGR